MKLNAIKSTTAALAALVALAAVSPAQSTTLVCGNGVCTQSGSIASQRTDYSASFGTFSLFNLAGATLTDVKVTFGANTMISGSVTNNNTSAATFTLKSVGNDTMLTSGANTPASIVNVADLLYSAPNVTYKNLGAGSTAAYPLTGTNAYPNAIISTVTDLGPAGFAGTGTFTLGMTTLSSFTVLGGGGNISTVLNQFESGNVAIEYDYTSASAVPEPTTWAMMIAGFALVSVGMRRRNASFAA